MIRPASTVTDRLTRTVASVVGASRGWGADLRIALNGKPPDVGLLRAERDRLAADLVWLARPLVMHHGRRFRAAPALAVEADERNERQRRVVGRVVRAYARARSEEAAVTKPVSMWELVEERQRSFVNALDQGDEEAVSASLAELMQSDLAWGIAASDPDDLRQLRAGSGGGSTQLSVADALVSFAEALGSARVSSYQQGPALQRLDLDVDLDEVARAVEARSGLDLELPSVGGPFGCRIVGKLITPDSLRHSYTLHRIRELGAGATSVVAEIGGGVGCLAALAYRAGIRELRIFDLPWVNALQGYYLGMALPDEAVRLFGEGKGSVHVDPYWRFEELEPRSVDFVVNTNSLPEVGLEAAQSYIRAIGRILRGSFLSFNHEGKLPVGTFGPQNCVRELAEASGALIPVRRARSWMWEGYVEEVYVSSGDGTGVWRTV